MAASSFLILLPLLFLYPWASPSSAAHIPNSYNPLCIYAPFRLLCAQLPLTQSSLTLAEFAVRAASAKVAAAIPTIHKLRSSYVDNKRMASTLDVCAEVYTDAVNDLNAAATALHRGGHINNIMDGLSASLTDIGTCDDAFDEDPSLFNPMAHISKNLNRLVTNSLSLTSAAKRRH